MKTERQQEWDCQVRFRERSPFYHVYSSHTVTEIVFGNEADADRIVNLMALYASTMRVRLLAYEIMSTHLHILYNAEGDAAVSHMAAALKHYALIKARIGEPVPFRKMVPQAVAIQDLKQFRDELAYIIRNRFVARPDVNPFCDPYGTSWLYFNPLMESLEQDPFTLLSVKRKRELIHVRDVNGLPDWNMLKGRRISPASFIDYRLVEGLFPNARKYVMWVMKNVEAQVEIAVSRGEKPMLNDDEMMALVFKQCRDMYSANGPSSLSTQQKRELAVSLHRNYLASNAQLARCLKLDLALVNSLFPLAVR